MRSANLAVSLRIAAVIFALVVLPGIVFAVAKNHPASHSIVGWTAYVPPGATTSSSTGYVSGTTTGDTMAEKAAIKADVAKWESASPWRHLPDRISGQRTMHDCERPTC